MGETDVENSVKKAFARARAKGLSDTGLLLHASVTDQKLRVVSKKGIALTYTISTSKYGTGSQAHSNKTPLGWHAVADRIGNHAIPGQVFVARQPVKGHILDRSDWQQEHGEDLVLTRIMRLRGLEPGKNSGGGVDSYKRFIYIHGTNQEQRLGTPASHGCIRMSNRDIMELSYTLGQKPAWCLIVQ